MKPTIEIMWSKSRRRFMAIDTGADPMMIVCLGGSVEAVTTQLMAKYGRDGMATCLAPGGWDLLTGPKGKRTSERANERASETGSEVARKPTSETGSETGSQESWQETVARMSERASEVASEVTEQLKERG